MPETKMTKNSNSLNCAIGLTLIIAAGVCTSAQADNVDDLVNTFNHHLQARGGGGGGGGHFGGGGGGGHFGGGHYEGGDHAAERGAGEHHDNPDHRNDNNNHDKDNNTTNNTTNNYDGTYGNYGEGFNSYGVWIGPGVAPYYYPGTQIVVPATSSGTNPVTNNNTAVAPSASAVQLMKAQVQLKSEGYYQGAVDGVSGASTQKAITAYQKDRNLGQTGTLDDATLKSLGVTK